MVVKIVSSSLIVLIVEHIQKEMEYSTNPLHVSIILI